ncbi:hypothetical protein LSH36_85g07077 [Paralvinella palmiformis]|uniref:Protein MCM10 homolog n=1 Tax=Paralvinella palmiformis TaxID=53620 RepID=A0AAD9K255_9ANNE|nr:hypothetical protein LSH36_85g07077 [Paralvinella palmiformis]
MSRSQVHDLSAGGKDETSKDMESMDDDQCNIDEIQALLDDHQADIADGENNTSPKCQQEIGGGANTDKESDDDIDEDELDKLTALVEDDTQRQADRVLKEVQPSFVEVRKPDNCTPRQSSTKSDKQAALASDIPCHNKCEMSVTNGLRAETVHVPKIGAVLSGSGTEADVLVKLSELSAMEDQIRLMKSQLLEKAKQISPEIATALSAPKLKLIDEDIFKPAETSPEQKKTSKSARPQPVKTTPGISSLSVAGNDSDSDWDDLDGQKPSSLSKEGKQIKKLLNQGATDRKAHTPKFDPLEELPKKKPYNSTWTQRAGLSSSPSTSSSASGSYVSSSGSDVISEPLSGMRIINPLVSSVTLKSLMSGRKMIHLSRLHLKVNTPDLDSDWVTIAVMVSKSEPRKSVKGNQYSIWRLSDLADCDKVVSLFLFNKVFQELWKTVPGTVIGILNPSIMQSAEKSSFSDLSITIDNPKKLLILGKSKDLGRCKSKTKAGNDCINFVNLQKGEYCTYHVQSAYKKTSAKRSELQSGINIASYFFSENLNVFHFYSRPNMSQIFINRFTGVVPRSFEKTLFNKSSSVIYGGQTYTTGSLGNKATKSTKKSITIASLQRHHVNKLSHDKPKITTLNLHDLLPEDEAALKTMKENKNDKFHDALCIPSVGSLNYVKHMMNSEKIKDKEKSKQSAIISVSVKDFLKSCEKEMEMKHNARKRTLQCKNKKLPDVVFDFDKAPVLPALDFKADIIKQRAIKKIQKKGGVKKEDPNAVKKSKLPSEVEQIKKRLHKPPGDDNVDADEQPPKKKSKILGNLDLDSSDVQRLIKARSKHDNELNEQEQEKQDQYFEVLEKKEQMEEKMSSVTEVKCKAYVCKQCKYRAMSVAPHCREQNHNIITSDATKKFFECKDCKQRTITIERYPHHPCRKCQRSGFVRCSMFKEKKGPQLSSETLCLRGDEIKFLNSLN